MWLVVCDDDVGDVFDCCGDDVDVGCVWDGG